jgi:hypothetical protein
VGRFIGLLVSTHFRPCNCAACTFAWEPQHPKYDRADLTFAEALASV